MRENSIVILTFDINILLNKFSIYQEFFIINNYIFFIFYNKIPAINVDTLMVLLFPKCMKVFFATGYL